jgi:hypothetical protein
MLLRRSTDPATDGLTDQHDGLRTECFTYLRNATVELGDLHVIAQSK